MNQKTSNMSWQKPYLPTSVLSSPFLDNLPVYHLEGLALPVTLSAGESEDKGVWSKILKASVLSFH